MWDPFSLDILDAVSPQRPLDITLTRRMDRTRHNRSNKFGASALDLASLDKIGCISA